MARMPSSTPPNGGSHDQREQTLGTPAAFDAEVSTDEGVTRGDVVGEQPREAGGDKDSGNGLTWVLGPS